LASPPFDWRSPHYTAIYAERAARLHWIRSHPNALPGLRTHYAEHIAQLIDEWGVTADPRLALLHPSRDVLMPFDIDYRASTEGALMPGPWIQFAGRRGQLLECLRSWSGQGSDIFQTTQRASPGGFQLLSGH
jgi:hypothetical protein